MTDRKRCPHRTFRPFVGREIPHGLMSVGVSPWTLHWSFSQEADEGGAIGNGLMM